MERTIRDTKANTSILFFERGADSVEVWMLTDISKYYHKIKSSTRPWKFLLWNLRIVSQMQITPIEMADMIDMVDMGDVGDVIR